MSALRTVMACVLAGALGGLCAVAIGCGGTSKLLTSSDADALKQSLTQVRQAVGARDCATAAARLKRLQGQVRTLSGTVDRGLRRNLREEIDAKLAPQVGAECDAPLTTTTPTFTTTTPTQPPPTTEPTSTTPPPTQPTDTTPTTPTTTTPTETIPPPADTAPPADALPGGTGGAPGAGGAGTG